MKLIFSMLPFVLFISCTSSLKPMNDRSDTNDQEQKIPSVVWQHPSADSISDDNFLKEWKTDTSHYQELVNRLSQANVLAHQYTGLARKKSEIYMNFESLKNVATTEQLIDLTLDSNSILAGYAGWALADRKSEKLPVVFREFQSSNRQVLTQNGCILYESNLETTLYYRYRNQTESEVNYQNDSVLLQLDSLILYRKNTEKTMLYHAALANRKYKEPYIRQIKYLAFDQLILDAIQYMHIHELKGNEKNIEIALTKYLKKDKIWLNQYEKVFDILLSLDQEHSNDMVCQELKEINDNNYFPIPEKYRPLLQEYLLK